jgi:hypothetical protein
MEHEDRTHASQGIVQVVVWLQHSTSWLKNVQSIAGYIPDIGMTFELVTIPTSGLACKLSSEACLYVLILMCCPINGTVCFIHHGQLEVPEKAVSRGLSFTEHSIGSRQSANTSSNT